MGYGKISTTRPLGIRTHGLSGTRVYRKWINMLCRCLNPKDINYKNYGARGITVCKRWHKFENFIEDMGLPKENETLDRVDNNKGYAKNNCRWVSYTVNSRNRRNNRIVTFQGKSKPIVQWAEELNMNRKTLVMRLNAGWSVERTLTTPTRKPYE